MCPSRQIRRLQRIQNYAARLVSRTSRTAHVSPLLRELHWLPIEKRILFKICTLTFKALHGLCPVYISELLEVYTPARELRSSSRAVTLTVPRTLTRTYGDRAFTAAAPRAWNALPEELRSETSLLLFRKKLKSVLFLS